MTTLDKIISPWRKTYAIECDNGCFEIDGCKFAIFDYKHKYVKIPGRPASLNVLQLAGFSNNEIEAIWIGFRKFAAKFADEATIIQFEATNKIYRYNNKYVALYCKDAIIVFKYDGMMIKATDIILAGFSQNDEAFVPLSEETQIAYYDTTNNTLICGW